MASAPAGPPGTTGPIGNPGMTHAGTSWAPQIHRTANAFNRAARPLYGLARAVRNYRRRL